MIVKINSRQYLNTDKIVIAELFHESGKKWKWNFSIQERKESIYSERFDNRGEALSWFFSMILIPTYPKLGRGHMKKIIWALFDSKGEFCGTYDTKQETIEDAYGPRFRPSFTIAKYELVKESIRKIIHPPEGGGYTDKKKKSR